MELIVKEAELSTILREVIVQYQQGRKDGEVEIGGKLFTVDFSYVNPQHRDTQYSLKPKLDETVWR
jgi:hypothetical protein